MTESLDNNFEKIIEWASDQLSKGEFAVVLSGEKLNFAVNLLSDIKDRFMRKGKIIESQFTVPNEIFLEFVTTRDLDRQNICMFNMLKQAGFQEADIRTYCIQELLPKYKEKLKFSDEKIEGIANSIKKALKEVFPTLN